MSTLLYVGYMTMVSVLMLNLLIAMLDDTWGQVRIESIPSLLPPRAPLYALPRTRPRDEHVGRLRRNLNSHPLDVARGTAGTGTTDSTSGRQRSSGEWSGLVQSRTLSAK